MLGGLWHGASVRFIVWGALHGTALAVHKLYLQLRKDRGLQPGGSWFGGFLAWLLTFHFVCFCWIFFRADSMATATAVIHRIFTAFQPGLIPAMIPAYARVFGLMALAYYLHWLPPYVKPAVQQWFARVPDLGKALLITAVVVLLFQVKNADIQPFIYFQF